MGESEPYDVKLLWSIQKSVCMLAWMMPQNFECCTAWVCILTLAPLTKHTSLIPIAPRRPRLRRFLPIPRFDDVPRLLYNAWARSMTSKPYHNELLCPTAQNMTIDSGTNSRKAFHGMQFLLCCFNQNYSRIPPYTPRWTRKISMLLRQCPNQTWRLVYP